MSDNLPGDVLSDILARLQAEDLVPCTAVCKKWYSLIKSPNFITLHLKKLEQDQRRNHLLVRYFTENPNREHYSLRVDHTFKQYKKLKFPFPTFGGLGVVGICNGLVCISDDQQGYSDLAFIWNPMIRKAVGVPEPNVSYHSHGPYMHSLGFGFDSLTNDYKIVRITHLHCEIVPPEVEVYSINTGYWRTISDVAPKCRVEERSQQAYVRGAAHWFATGWFDSRKNAILSFDMKDETFGEMPVPESVLYVGNFCNQTCLIGYQESISLFHHHGDNYCTMWVMKNYGVADSWVKQFTVDLRGGIERTVGIRSNGEVLFANRGSLVSYNHEDKRTLKLPIKGIKFLGKQVFYVGNYTNSLVLLDKGPEFYDATICEKYYYFGKGLKQDEEEEADEEEEEEEDTSF